MNDTILNKREALLLEILQTRASLSRKEIAELASLQLPAAPITILRDLNDLVKKGFLEKHGSGRATTYRLREQNPLLAYVYLDDYFAISPDERNVTVTFDRGIFHHTKNFFTSRERKQWDASAVLLKRQRGQLNATLYKREFERFLIDLAWKSSQIEGNTYDLIETETLIKDKIRARGHTEEEATMILNHKKAFEFIRTHETIFKKPLTRSAIIQLHRNLTEGLGVSLGLRDHRVYITGTRYIPPHGQKVTLLFDEVIVAINRLAYPPERALAAACLIPYLQPFADGNKRTGRMLANAILFAHGYYPFSYRNVDATEYRKAIILIYEQNNMYHMKRIFLEQLEFAIDNYFRS